MRCSWHRLLVRMVDVYVHRDIKAGQLAYYVAVYAVHSNTPAMSAVFANFVPI